MNSQPVYASLDLGGTKIACAFATADGTIIAEKIAPTEAYLGPYAVVERMGSVVKALAEQTGHQPAGLGIGIPGLADVKNGIVKFLPNLPTKWPDIPVRDLLEPQIGCPVFLLNDVRTATLGELTYGHGQAGGTMAFFALGTGIGGGIAIDGKLRLGPLGAAGELGHIIVEPHGPSCGCGSYGCLETLASGPAIAAKGVWLVNSGRAPKLYDLVEGDTSRITAKEMAQAAALGDADVRAELIRAARYIGLGVVNVVVVIHPDMVVLGGSVAQIGDLLFDTVQETLTERVGMFPTDGVQILPSKLGTAAGTLGGIALAAKGGQV